MSSIRWHTDKNGCEIRYDQRLLGDDGNYYEIFGTGMWLTGDTDVKQFWTAEQKLVWRSTKTMRCVPSDKQRAAIFVYAVIVAILSAVVVHSIINGGA